MEPGTQLGHYEILSAIGKGGMGEVWRAEDTKLGRDVAIKTLPSEFAQDADRLARFEREAKLLASLNHPNIAAIYGLEEHEGSRFLVLELVEGDTLADRLKQGALPVEESLKLALQIAEALEAAHEKSVIHRDLKPANIKVTPDGKVKVLDFGLAKAFAGEQPDANLSNSPTLSMQATQAGLILGTAAYMSPEQASGKETDLRADVWSFGVVLFEMLTGRQVFDGETVSHVLAAVLAKDPQWDSLPHNLHPRLRQLLDRCIAKDLKDRYTGIADARVDIEKVLADPDGVLVQPVAEIVQAAPQSKGPWVAAVVLALITGVAVWNLRPAPEPGPVVRLAHVLPEGERFSTANRQLVAVSPDATRIVYVANSQLYLRNLGELEARPIQGTETNPHSPFFSPDGEWIGYWSSSNEIVKIPIGGGVAVSLTDAIGSPDPSWGADNTIVYSQPEGIMRVSANGGTPEVLISAAGESLRHPRVLSNDYLLFHVFPLAQGQGEDEGQVVVQAADSEERKPLFTGTGAEYVPTGHIVYQVDDVLYGVAFDIDALEVTAGPVALLEGVRPRPPTYALSDSGTLVYVPGGGVEAQRTLVWVDREGTETPINAPPGGYVYARLSPDDSKLALDIRDGESDIWIWDLSRETLSPLTLEPGINRIPIWSPDGERIAFTAQRDGTENIYWQSADRTGEPELLAEGSEPLAPHAFSPDETQFLFTGIVPPRDISLLNLSSNETELLLAAPYNEFNPVLSPNGNWMAFETDESGQSDVYVRPFPDVNAGRFLISTGGASRPLWSRDGNELFYLETPGRVMAVTVDEGPPFSAGVPRIVVDGDYVAPNNGRTYDVSSDGQRFLMIKDVGAVGSDVTSPQVNIVLNWFEELKERVPVP